MWIELVWVLLGVIAIGHHIYGIWDAHEDIIAIRSALFNGPRKLAAKGKFRRETLRLFVQLMFITVGVQALLTPNPRTDYSLRSIIFIAAFMLAQLALVINSVLDTREGIKMLEMFKEEQERVRIAGRPQRRKADRRKPEDTTAEDTDK